MKIHVACVNDLYSMNFKINESYFLYIAGIILPFYSKDIDPKAFCTTVRLFNINFVERNFILILNCSLFLSGHEIISTAILSSGAVVSYWRKYGYLILVNRLGRLPRNSVVWLSDRARNDLNSVEEP